MRAFLLFFLALSAAPAFAQEANQITIRGNYWRDRNTRVLQPEALLSKELATGTIVGAHYLLDAITSASQAAGAIRDEPFTELRNEVGFRVAQRAGRALMSLGYSYSSESDYWAHLFTVGTSVDLFQKNTTLALNMSWGINEVARRAGPISYTPVGGLATWNAIASWTQVLTQRLLLIVEYDLSVLGFGDRIGSLTGLPNASTGFLANPYRSVNLGGSPAPEQLPFQRIRQSAQLNFHWLISTGNRIVPYLAFRPSYRFYWDDWGVMSHTPELRWYVPVGPVEFRLTGRYYNQTAAVFANTIDGRPGYPDSTGKPCNTCLSDASRGFYFTGDPKLYASDSFYFDVRLLISLRGLGRFKKLPAHQWLAGGFIEVSYGHWFVTKVPQLSFGDADLAGIAFSFPL